MRLFPLMALICACSSAGEAHKVVLLQAGSIDAGMDESLMRGIEEGLDEMGFDAILDTTPLGSVDVTQARARAATVSAAHSVIIELSAHKERPGFAPGSHLWALEATAHVINERPEHAAVEPYHMPFVSEAASPARFATGGGKTWRKAFVPFIADELVHSPQLHTVLGGQGDTQALIAVTELKKYQDLIESRHETVEEYDAWCKAERERIDAHSLSEGGQCYGDPCGQYALVGVTHEGRPVAQEASRRPIFTAPPKRKGFWAEPPERLISIAEDGSETVLLRSSNFYSLGASSRGGQVVTAEAFTSEGVQAILGVSANDGKLLRTELLSGRERIDSSEISADGAYAFLCARGSGRDCELRADTKKRVMPELTWGRWAKAGESLRLVAMNTDGETVLVDPETEKTAVVRHEGSLHRVAGSRGEGLAFIARSGRSCSLITASAEGEVLSTDAMPQCLSYPNVLADGRLVGTAEVSHHDDAGGDDEVVIWEPGTEVLFPLTTGSFHEEMVYPSPDGTVAWFSRKLDSPTNPRFDTRVYRRMVCRVEIPPA